MKAKLILMCISVMVVLGLMACSSGGATAAVSASCDDFLNSSAKPAVVSKQIEVAEGNTFTVTLCSNATTGYKWSESAQISAPTVLQQTDHKFVAPEAKPGMVGVPGNEVWTFKALRKGTANVFLEYGQPWAGGEKGAWKFNLTVVVK